DVQWVMSAYHVPSGSDADFAALDLVVLTLGDTPAGRLHKGLVETKQASQVFGGDFQLYDPGTDADFAALDLVVLTLGDTPAGLLHKGLVETKQASQVFGGDFQLYDPGT